MKSKLPAGITQRKNGLYQARYTSMTDHKRHTLYDRDLKNLVQRLAAAKQEDLNASRETDPEKVARKLQNAIHAKPGTVDHWFRTWMKEWKTPQLKPTSIQNYNQIYTCHIGPVIGHLKLKTLRSVDVQPVFQIMNEKKLSKGTMRLTKSILSAMFRQAIACDLLDKNPLLGIQLPKAEKTQTEILDRTGRELFLSTIKDRYYESLYLIALCTGLRIGELTALTWSDIDLVNGCLYVRKTLLYGKDPDTGQYGYRYQSPKTSTSERCVPLIADAITIFNHHKKQQQLQKKRARLEGYWAPLKKFPNLVFTTRNGTPVQECYVDKDLHTISRRMNEIEAAQARLEHRSPIIYPVLTPHKLRHMFASEAYANGMPIKVLQSFLGHSNVSTTLGIYVTTTEKNKRDELFRIETILQAKENGTE